MARSARAQYDDMGPEYAQTARGRSLEEAYTGWFATSNCREREEEDMRLRTAALIDDDGDGDDCGAAFKSFWYRDRDDDGHVPREGGKKSSPPAYQHSYAASDPYCTEEREDYEIAGSRATVWGRERGRIFVGLTLLVVVVTAIVGAATGGSGSGDGTIAARDDAAPGRRVSFAVVSDTPYNSLDRNLLSEDLSSLPPDVEFVVHLGDVSLAAASGCATSVYEEAAETMRASSAPVLVLPGNDDWNDCPDPGAAWKDWKTNLNRFEDNFDDAPTNVERQFERSENFSFLRGGVLFVGVHLTGGKERSARRGRVEFT